MKIKTIKKCILNKFIQHAECVLRTNHARLGNTRRRGLDHHHCSCKQHEGSVAVV